MDVIIDNLKEHDQTREDNMGPHVHCTKHGICRMYCTSWCNTKKRMSEDDIEKFRGRRPRPNKPP